MLSGMINNEEEQNSRYFNFLLIFITVSLLLLVWIIIVVAGIIIFEFDPKWALLSLDTWIYTAGVFILFFIFLELMLYFGYNNGNNIIEEEKPNQKNIYDKKLYVYTYPKEAKGGIFSKTYILINENSVLNLRCLMISPGKLWDEKET
jgi:hypothetical protein